MQPEKCTQPPHQHLQVSPSGKVLKNQLSKMHCDSRQCEIFIFSQSKLPGLVFGLLKSEKINQTACHKFFLELFKASNKQSFGLALPLRSPLPN
jgi:hypothetical protein